MIFKWSENFWQVLLAALVCYLIGCLNAALFISRAKHRDIRKMGSGNPGTMNVSRELGWRAGLLTFCGDALKAGIPVVIAYFVFKGQTFENTSVAVSDFMRYFCGFFVVLGHVFPITMRFKGGKGIASTFGLFWGALAVENAWWILGMFALFMGVLLFIYFTEWGGLGSLFGVSTFSVIQLLYFHSRYAKTPLNAELVCLFCLILAINIITWLAHYKNLRRLFSGEEHKTSLKLIVNKTKKLKEEKNQTK